ncbi:unnamed protein product [Cuscuta epithymum]|uniref:Cystatin domain-containing protein n=1 Tax=Cuscuta epithymum TaxID=186058 RepID=A0AAV0CUL2_9ASTE|nr:unnamed protein product [Cuscuta epithymum]CAH9128209.1 unnamed protein product [Cuscuta epithymum]
MEKIGNDPAPDCCEFPLKRYKTHQSSPISKTFLLHCGDQKAADDSLESGEEKLIDGSNNSTARHVSDPESMEEKLGDGSSGITMPSEEEEMSSDEERDGGDFEVGVIYADNDCYESMEDDDEKTYDSTATNDSDDSYAGNMSDYESKKEYKKAKKYNKVLSETDGFGVITVIPKGVINGIWPIKLKGTHQSRLEKYTDMAIQKYNSENDTSLEFVGIVRANLGMGSGYIYYITFRARDTVSGVVNAYEAKAFHSYVSESEHYVLFVRLAEEQMEV